MNHILSKTIKKDIEKSLEIMTIEEVNQLYLQLQQYALVDEVTKKIHIKNIKGKESIF